MLVRARWLILIVLAAATASVAALMAAHRRHGPPPLQVSLWYWHRPFRVTKSEGDSLARMGVRELFVHAGTFRQRGSGLALTLPQEWTTPACKLPVQLVFNFDYGVVRGFAKADKSRFAGEVWARADAEVERARRAGVTVSGIQLDFDCPTRRLPKYGAVLRWIRQRAARERLSLSITALMTWLPAPEAREMAGAVDFIVPQFYEAVTPANRSAFRPIFSPDRLERGLRAAGRLGIPFYAGLPAYGHALVYDDHDRLAGMYHDAGPAEILRDPRFHLNAAYPASAEGGPATPSEYNGEEVVDFLAPSPDGATGAWHLRFDLPSPALVARALAILNADRPASCRGAILFRYPEPRESETVSLAGLEAAVAGREAKPDIRVRIASASAPWELIDTPRAAARPPQEVTVTIENRGQAATFFSPDSVALNVRFDRPGFELPRREDSQETLRSNTAFDSPGPHAVPASPGRSDLLRIHLPALGAGESVRIGPIRLPADGAARVRADWTARAAGGFETLTGTLPALALGGGRP